MLVGAVWLAICLRDTPESLGLPPVEGTADMQHDIEPIGSRCGGWCSQPYIWLLSFANFFVYTVRYGILDWGPTFLKQARGIELTSATWIVAAFEGVRHVRHALRRLDHRSLLRRPGRAGLLLLHELCTGALLLFWILPEPNVDLQQHAAVPGRLLHLRSAKPDRHRRRQPGHKRAAAAAVGLTGLFGY